VLDTLQVVLWSTTYVLIIVAGFQSFQIKKVSMPYMALLLNFTWEFCALLVSKGFWGHIAWFTLDFMILVFAFLYMRSNKAKALLAIAIPIGIVLLRFVFTLPFGMLYSSFVIDLLMAINFIIDHKKLSPKLKVPIAVAKLLGDACAGMQYAGDSWLIVVIACVVFICNVYYLYLCEEEVKVLESL